jgi:type VI secretion system protein ImpA
LERIEDPDMRAARIPRGAATLQTLQKAVSETPADFFPTLRADLSECSDEFEKLCAGLEEKCGQDASGYSLAPPSSNIRNALQACREAIEHLAGPAPAAGGAETSEASAAASAGAAAASVGQIRNREDAFRALLQVAEFFKRTEPHSPVSYALEQAVRWGRMSLPDLLSELVSDGGAREQIFRLIGIRSEQERASPSAGTH